MKRWKFALMGLTTTLCVCLTSCAMAAVAIGGAFAYLNQGAPLE